MAPKTDESGIKPLLDTLWATFSNLSALILKRRMASYRPDTGALKDDQMLAGLYDMVGNTSTNAAGAADRPGEAGSGGPTADGTGTAAAQSSTTAAMGSNKDLSGRLQSGKSGTSESRHLKEKLQASAWEHIHASLRYVRQGNASLAKMHADLANEALKQVSHYMAGEEYIELQEAVREELKKVRE